jgi:hypothetical protein
LVFAQSTTLSSKYLTINRSVSSAYVKLDNLSYSRTVIIYNRTHLHLIQSFTCKAQETRDCQCQSENAIAPVHTLLMFPQYLRTGITSQPFIKQKYDLCICLPPPAIPTRCARSTAQPCYEPKVSQLNLVRCSEIYHGICQGFYTLMVLTS